MCPIVLEKFEVVGCKIKAVKVKEQVFLNSFEMMRFHLSNGYLKK
jgi:hypothetical protein